jgi:hypothetical protein
LALKFVQIDKVRSSASATKQPLPKKLAQRFLQKWSGDEKAKASKPNWLEGKEDATHFNLNLFYPLSVSSPRWITNLVGSFATLLILFACLMDKLFCFNLFSTLIMDCFYQ